MKPQTSPCVRRPDGSGRSRGWALHFAVVYGYTGLACARALDRSVPWVVGVSTLVLGAVAALLFARGAGGRGADLHRVGGDRAAA